MITVQIAIYIASGSKPFSRGWGAFGPGAQDLQETIDASKIERRSIGYLVLACARVRNLVIPLECALIWMLP